MTIAEWLVNSMLKLKDAGVPNGRTDALVLLADLFGTDKSWVHAHPEKELDSLQLRELDRSLGKRLERIPLAYIRGFTEFYGRDFVVNSHVLVPRPESEAFIEILNDLKFKAPRIADIGTGSGCLGITATLEIPDSTVNLYDNSPAALAVAEHNAALLGAEVGVFESDLLGSLGESYDILLANLPYVPAGRVSSPEISAEPAAALFSGADGMEHYKRFWSEVKGPRYVLVESLEEQNDKMEALAASAGYKLVLADVLVQLFKHN